MFPQWLTDAASVASIVSLFVSLYVAWRIRAISYHYRQVALVPKAILTIRKHLKVLDTHIRSKNWHEIKKEAASITASVDQAKALTTGSTKQAADRTYEAVRTVLESESITIDNSGAIRLYLALTQLHSYLVRDVESKKWQ